MERNSKRVAEGNGDHDVDQKRVAIFKIGEGSYYMRPPEIRSESELSVLAAKRSSEAHADMAVMAIEELQKIKH